MVKKKLRVKYFKNEWKLLGKFLNAYKYKKEENNARKSQITEWSLRLQNSDKDFITWLGAFTKVILNLSIN